MLSLEEQKKIKRGFDRGLPDTLIAKKLDLQHMAVYKYRKKCGITKDVILKNRYDTWARLLESGLDIKAVAARYEVKPVSIRVALWRDRNFSFVEVKRKIRQEEELRASRFDEKKIDW